jgi:hypothetical protein
MEAEGQKNHLKACELHIGLLEKKFEINWLLNYRGRFILFPDAEEIRKNTKLEA